jgi:hypothetical protein
MKTERADPANNRHHGAKKKTDRDSHMLGGFTVLGAITKRARRCLLRGQQNEYQQ